MIYQSQIVDSCHLSLKQTKGVKKNGTARVHFGFQSDSLKSN